MKRLTHSGFMFISFFLFLAFVQSAGGQSIDDLNFYIDEYPPYNFIENDQVTGISVDLILEMLKMTGSRSGREDIELVPWARGYNYALTKKNIILFVMTRTPERENLFQWVGPVASSNMVLVARKSSRIKIDSVEDIREYALGAVRDDIGEMLLRRLLGDGIEISLTNNGINCARQLNLNRIDLWSYEENVAFWFIKKAGLDPDDFEVVYSIEEASEWFALSRRTDPAIVDQLQDALDRISSRTRKRILNRYLK